MIIPVLIMSINCSFYNIFIRISILTLIIFNSHRNNYTFLLLYNEHRNKNVAKNKNILHVIRKIKTKYLVENFQRKIRTIAKNIFFIDIIQFITTAQRIISHILCSMWNTRRKPSRVSDL